MVSDEQLIDDLQQFAEELGETPTQKQMKNSGPWSVTAYKGHFFTWNKALKVSGLEANKEMSKPVSRGRLINDLQEFAGTLGKIPTKNDMNNSGPWPANKYRRKFGSWNSALKAAGFEIKRLGKKERAGIGDRAYGEGYKEKRHDIYKRDNYECRICGSDNELHCHHIKPRREFDDVNDSNTLDNLITLCPSCHARFEGNWIECDPDEFAEKAKDVITTTTNIP